MGHGTLRGRARHRPGPGEHADMRITSMTRSRFVRGGLLGAAMLASLMALVAAGGARTRPDAVATGADGETTIILVRHAEKLRDPAKPGDADPPLSAEGEARAQWLGTMLASAGVDRVLVSDRRRTALTAQPLVELVRKAGGDVEVGTYQGAGGEKAIAQAIRALGAGHVVLVVGHSNQLPGVVKELGGWEVPGMGEADFDDVYIASIGGTRPRLIHAGYAPRSAP